MYQEYIYLYIIHMFGYILYKYIMNNGYLYIISYICIYIIYIYI